MRKRTALMRVGGLLLGFAILSTNAADVGAVLEHVVEAALASQLTELRPRVGDHREPAACRSSSSASSQKRIASSLGRPAASHLE